MRTYKRKSNRGNTPHSGMECACKGVISRKKIICFLALQYGIPYKTLHRYVNTWKKNLANPSEILNNKLSHTKSRQIFDDNQEKELREHGKKATDIYYGLASYELRKFAYQFAIKNTNKVPHSWNEKKVMGED